MGKKSSGKSVYSKRTYCYKGWRQNSKDGQELTRLLMSGELSPAYMPAQIKEKYPPFRKYKKNSFSGGLRRLKAKLGLLTRKDKGHNTGKSLFVAFCFLLVLFLSLDTQSLTQPICFFFFFFFQR